MSAGPVDPDLTVSSTGAPPREVPPRAAEPALDPDVTATIAPALRGAARAEPHFPVAKWDRYEAVRFLGAGGMGKVFLARDVRLGREVAIKFVQGDNPAHIERLVAEARAQARVDHPRVCKVYEVGEVEGEVYIAMQYIAGATFAAMRGELSVEQKAMVLRDAALGLHEAHRAGIVHRDVKPGNIMVSRAEDGRLDPFVMDFGLARSFNEGETETGAVMGTPHYMSPEQARGEVARLDRRADVYSLGATLYYMLTGQPSVPGANALEVLSNVAVAEPVAPRVLDRDIPADLEAIVLKCIEKERSARYDSARALAEDLDRFLRGDAVEARATGTLYRLRKKLAKHRRAAALVSAAGVIVALALGFGLAARAEAKERERLAQRFTELVERIESMARYSALSPLHDVRGDRAALRARMAELEGEIQKAGPIAKGPGHYALGRGYLALDDEVKAKELLESAWKNGYQEPRAAYSLALVMGHLYRQGLVEAERIEDAEQRAARKKDIEKRYRDPALAYLRKSQGAEAPSSAYVAALGAFWEDRLDEALRHLEGIGAGLPWFWEAHELAGTVLLARAAQRARRGERELAEADFEAGRREYLAAAAVGESVPRVHLALAELEHSAMLMELYGSGAVDPPFERGIAAVRRAQRALPEHYESWVLDSELHRRLAEYRANRGGNAEELLQKAIVAAESALRAAPNRPAARSELARAHYQWGAYRQERQQNPEADLKEALRLLDSLPPEDRDYQSYLHMGLVNQTWADYDDLVGRDPLPHQGEAIRAYLSATRLDPLHVSAWINLGTTYFMRASHPRGPEPASDLAEAKKALDRARQLNPKHVVPYFLGGQIHELLAERKRSAGGDARPELTTALDLYRRGVDINPKLPQLHNGVGTVLLELGREAWDRGQSPDELMGQARAAFEQAIAVAPDQGFAHNNVGDAWVRHARHQHARGEDPEASVRAAETSLLAAIERIPEHATPWTNIAGAHLVEARFQIDHGQDPREALALATAALAEALARNPNEMLAMELLGEARGIGARFEGQRGLGSSRDFERAAEAYLSAIELDPKSHEHSLALGHFYADWGAWEKAQGRDPGPLLKKGLDLANRVLAARPDGSDALALRARLALAAAQTASRPEEQREQAARAAADFTKALSANPHLEHAWRSQAALAARLAGR